MPKIKICGVTNAEDALLAERLGADFIGIIFAQKSPRAVEIAAAKNIAAALKTAKTIGVFVEQTHKETAEIAAACGLWGVQHYTYFSQGFADAQYIYAMRLGAPESAAVPQDFSLNFSLTGADYVLIDSYDEKQHGGTGKVFDWAEIPSALPRARLFLAGGLNADNIGAAAGENVFALDLSSGVEARPGHKDPEKLKQLFINFKDAMAQL